MQDFNTNPRRVLKILEIKFPQKTKTVQYSMIFEQNIALASNSNVIW